MFVGSLSPTSATAVEVDAQTGPGVSSVEDVRPSGRGPLVHEGSAQPDVVEYLTKSVNAAASHRASIADHGSHAASDLHVAIVVCGPSGLTDAVYSFTEEWGNRRLPASGDLKGSDSASGGARVDFHVHHETFML